MATTPTSSEPTDAEVMAWARATGHVKGTPEFDGNPDFDYSLAYLREHYLEQQAAEDAEDAEDD